MRVDQYPAGSLNDLDEFRGQKFSRLYLCRNCARSFDTVSKITQCKFCDSEDVQVISSKKSTSAKYRYYCPVCERNFMTNSKVRSCEFCGNKHIHMNEWESAAQRDEFPAGLWKFFSNFLKKQDTSEKKPKKESGISTDFLKNLKKPELRFSLSSRRSEEEMPTK
ncbi:MAG: hypothetical protein HYW26_02905 [Candidatus Aenigmarchaeota archaeon]|nr:hypothetical protein [Candidatus Aenigmarchaeota archaeon]